jgi:hypothetical protein
MVTPFCAQELNSQSRGQNTLISIHELNLVHLHAPKLFIHLLLYWFIFTRRNSLFTCSCRGETSGRAVYEACDSQSPDGDLMNEVLKKIVEAIYDD